MITVQIQSGNVPVDIEQVMQREGQHISPNILRNLGLIVEDVQDLIVCIVVELNAYIEIS